MPKDGTVGFSDNTPYKHDHFDKLVQAHMRIVRGIIHRHTWAFSSYVYLDLNAGSGHYYDEDGHLMLGSPIRAALLSLAQSLPMLACLCEQSYESVGQLIEAFHAHQITSVPREIDEPDRLLTSHHDIWIFEDQYSIGIPWFIEQRLKPLAVVQGTTLNKVYGLIYSDENGTLPPFALLEKCAIELPLVDQLIHVAATPIKRQIYSPKHHLNQRLDEMLATIPKKYWFVRLPYGQHQWTFLLGTNWDAFPEFTRQHFYRTDSPEGQSILRRLSYNRKDYDGQGDLFSA